MNGLLSLLLFAAALPDDALRLWRANGSWVAEKLGACEGGENGFVFASRLRASCGGKVNFNFLSDR